MNSELKLRVQQKKSLSEENFSCCDVRSLDCQLNLLAYPSSITTRIQDTGK